MKRMICIGLILCSVHILVIIAVLIDICNLKEYSTTDLANYGILTSDDAESRAQELFDTLFPKRIEEHFENVQYSYRSENVDSWDFEIYLEFTISDTETFREYVRSVATEDQFVPFLYDEAFLDYTLSNYYHLEYHLEGEAVCKNGEEDSADRRICIGSAEIAKFLANPEEQRIIIVALGVFDGGGARHEDYMQFFNRFGIDPVEYDKVY